MPIIQESSQTGSLYLGQTILSLRTIKGGQSLSPPGLIALQQLYMYIEMRDFIYSILGCLSHSYVVIIKLTFTFLFIKYFKLQILLANAADR